MWSVDKKNFEEEEKRLKDRIDKINKDNANFLLRQMEQKHREFQKMNRNEFAINKALLKEANNKFKDISTHSGFGNAPDNQSQQTVQ